MKCPRCGEEISSGKVCDRCGEEMPSKENMEVEYKEFKVTELLDIRMHKSDREASADEKKGPQPAKGTKPEKGFRTSTETKQRGKSPLLVLTAVIVAVLVVIAGLYIFGFL